MKTYLEAYRERLERNHNELIALADAVIKENPEIEVYHYRGDRFIQGLVFIHGEMFNSINFHEVPYRWSGCGYEEHGKYNGGGENHAMPFTVKDVLSTFRPITSIRKDSTRNFYSKEDYLKWCSYLTRKL